MTLRSWDATTVDFERLLGLTFEKITKSDDRIKFYLNDRHYFIMEHSQDCCESVYIENIDGDLDDLIGNPILHAEASTKDDPEAGEVGMWTFYKIATVKGWVDIRWYGSSNGYYGIGVDLDEYDLDKIEKTKAR